MIMSKKKRMRLVRKLSRKANRYQKGRSKKQGKDR